MTVRARTRLFPWSYYQGGGRTRGYDVSPDGRRFLALSGLGAGDQAAEPARVVIVQNGLGAR